MYQSGSIISGGALELRSSVNRLPASRYSLSAIYPGCLTAPVVAVVLKFTLLGRNWPGVNLILATHHCVKYCSLHPAQTLAVSRCVARSWREALRTYRALRKVREPGIKVIRGLDSMDRRMFQNKNNAGRRIRLKKEKGRFKTYTMVS